MGLNAGRKLGPYEILGPLGAGGMGEVYRARDTRLDRSVAVKVLPAEAAGQEDRRARFEREARVVSSLNHPHICALYDIGNESGVDYLVMELLEGETLARRLERGALSIEETLRHGVEIGEALSAAHRGGVVHRDLKPGNIVLTKTGAKLLDFGLAAVEPLRAGPEGATLTAPLTGEGTIVGTFQYMAPEQLEGKKADARSDIFAFGSVLYEMATGRRAFDAAGNASLIGAIMATDPPPVSEVRPLTPPALSRAIRQCLAKDPDDRWQSAADLARELRWIAEGGSQAGVPAPVVERRRLRQRLAWGVAALCLLAAAALAVALLRIERPPVRAIRFTVPAPPGTTLMAVPVVSPEGDQVLIGAAAGGPAQLWVHRFATGESAPVRGTESITVGDWWPDSRSIIFPRQGKAYRLDLNTGAEQLMRSEGETSGSVDYGVTAFSVPGKGLFAGPLDGQLRLVAGVDAARGESTYFWPRVLPGGRSVVSYVGNPRGSGTIQLIELDSGKKTPLVAADSYALYAPPGYLLYVSGSTLIAQRFDAGRGKLAGRPVPLVERIPAILGITFLRPFSVSKNGVLVFRGGVAASRLTWYDRTGKLLGSVGQPADYGTPALSPDGTRVAVTVRDPAAQKRDIQIFDLARGSTQGIVADPADDFAPAWSPDGTRLIFTSDRKGARDLYVRSASGAGEDTLLFESGENKNVEDWSPDGHFVAFNQTKPGNFSDLWLLPMEGAERKPFPLEKSRLSQRQLRFSPNGKWIAYVSGESRQSEVFIQPFPPDGARQQISTSGGLEPQWRADGKELFYLAGSKLMAVDMDTTGGRLKAAIPRALFEAALGPTGSRNRYLAAGDGKRFLVLTPLADESAKGFTVILNWQSLLPSK